jgi:hypothetical protein
MISDPPFVHILFFLIFFSFFFLILVLFILLDFDLFSNNYV